jgi:TolB-like protein/Tfp pilus assembly protein PilF/tRNA A-37 threonylcarbamoyl transferase component Bud32
MSPERWKLVEEIFGQALDLPHDERKEFLSDVCGRDAELRVEVENLLRNDEEAGAFIAAPAFDVRQHVTGIERAVAGQAAFDEEEEAPMTGRRIGAYRVVREIGRGGMGTVYLAVRADDEYHKRVAIKLVKRGMDTEFILKRFRNERQILASLDHPNIAHLLDGGTTDDGLPYFVMEYIQGQPVDRYSDNARCTIAHRLKLFRQVCSAVHYAHQNLVIHRDIKPSNILVTADGTPKLLDFGIAKLLNPDIAADTIDPTQTAMRMMTPRYASPEQLRGEVATPLSDLYTLGVLLYELLTGHHPYRYAGRAPHEIARVVCEEDPERPSTAVGRTEEVESAGGSGHTVTMTPEQVSKNRGTTPETLKRELSRGLDQIVMKAMRKEPQMRYASVEEFSEDIRRYLEGSPISAPTYFSPSRQKSKELAGGPAPVWKKSIAVLPFKLLQSSVGDDTGDFLGVGLADALITRLSNMRTITVRPTSSVMRFTGEDSDPVSAGNQLGVDYVLDGHILKSGDRVRVTVQLVSMEQSAPLWAGRFDETHGDILTLHDSLAEKVSKELVPQLTGEERARFARRGTNSPEAYEAYLRGRIHWNSMSEEGFAKALTCFYEAVALDPSFAAAHSGIADYYNWLGILGVMPPGECYDAAKEAATRASALDPASSEAFAALGFANHAQWEWAIGERHLRRAIELNPNYATAHQFYSFLLASMRRFDEAEREALRAIEIDPESPTIHQAVGWVYYQARRFEHALKQNEKVFEIDPDFIIALYVQSRASSVLGRHEEAVEAARRACELSGSSPSFLAVYGQACALAGLEEEARGVLAQLSELSKQRFVSPYHIALVHIGLGQKDEAFACLEEAYKLREGWLTWILTDAVLDPLREDPRFAVLVERMRQYDSQNRAGGGNGRQPAAPRELDSQERRPTLLYPAGEAQKASTPGDGAATVAAPRPTTDEEAYQLYVAGRYFSTRRTAEGLRQAIERLEHAVERDPQFALAYAELADCYALLNWYAEPPPEDAWGRAKRAALKAIEADDSLAEAHASLGFIMSYYDRDGEGAERELRRAIELKPGNPVAHRWYAFNLSAMGRHEEALAEIRKAQELSPRSPVIATGVANVLFFAQRFDEAIEQCRRALELDPGSLSTHIVLRWSYERKGMCQEALAVNEQERAFAGDTPTTRAKHAHVLAACGRAADAREILHDLIERREEQWVTAYEIAVVYTILGERDEALSWLSQAEREHSVGLTYIRVDPRLDPLRTDPRFQELLGRVCRATTEERMPSASEEAPHVEARPKPSDAHLLFAGMESAGGDAPAAQSDGGRSASQSNAGAVNASRRVGAQGAVGGSRLKSRTNAFVAAGVLLAALASLAAYFYFYGAAKTGIDSIAVLPFANVNSDPDTEYLSDGLTEHLINQLSQLPGLRVMARTTAFSYKGKTVDPRVAGRELGVGAVLVGRITKRDDRLLIQADLVRVSDGAQLWGERYSRKFSDLLIVQQDIASEILDGLRLKLSGVEEQQLNKRYTQNPEAYQLYMQAEYHRNRARPEDLKRSIELFNLAIARDSNFALAYVGLASAYRSMPAYGAMTPQEAYPRSREAATRALSIDPSMSAAHVPLASIRFVYDWDFRGAEQEYRQAVQLNQNSAEAHFVFANFLTAMTRFDEALAEYKIAKQLDPLSANIMSDMSWSLYAAGRYEEALEQSRQALDRDPNHGVSYLHMGEIYTMQGKYDEAFEALKRAKQMISRNALVDVALGHAYAMSGRTEEARQVLLELEARSRSGEVSPFFLAVIHTALGEKEEALKLLEQSYEVRSNWMVLLKVGRRLAPLQSDPRFQKLLKDVGFPE